jgi:hypothetical protein
VARSHRIAQAKRNALSCTLWHVQAMHSKPPLNPSDVFAARAKHGSVSATARALGVGRNRVARVLASRVRTEDEIKPSESKAVRSPRRPHPTFSWSLEMIRGARDAQLRGDFRLPVQLARAMRTDDALFVARRNRVAPLDAIATTVRACGSTRGESVARKARAHCLVSRSVLKSISSTLADHGIAIGYLEHEVTEDGGYIEFRLTEWPLEFVKWNASREALETSVRDGLRTDIVHGDGRWIVFRRFLVEPWAQDACLLPGALVFAAHGNGIRDWAAASTAHGQAKIVGELPQGVSLQGANGVLTPEASAFLQMLEDIVSGESGAAIRPFASKTDFISNNSMAWQVFNEFVMNREKAAARIYNGTDAALGSVGGAPGVDISALFSISTTILQGDFGAIEQGLDSGLYAPWTALNYGDSTYAPGFHFEFSDPDAERKSEENATARDRLTKAIKDMRDANMLVTQETINALAKEFGVKDPPQLAPAAQQSIPLALAPTDVARVIRVREARASQGLPPLGDERDDMFLSQLEALVTAPAPSVAP